MRSRSLRLSFFAAALFIATAATAALAQSPSPTVALTATAAPTLTATPPTPAPRSPSVIVPGRVYEGNLFGTTADFIVNAELGQMLVFEMNSASFDAVFEIYDAEGNQVARDDDGGAGNLPYLIFTAPSTGEFKLTVRGFSDPVDGTYAFRVNNDIESLTVGEALTVEIDGVTSTIYGFEAERGDVINLSATSDNSVDTTLRLLGPDGVEISYVDDFEGVDPVIRRLPLSQSGRHFIVHAPYSDSAVGTVILLLERTSLASLSADPVRIEMVTYSTTDMFNLAVEEGQLYVVELASTTPASGSLRVSDLDNTEIGSVNFNTVQRTSLAFRAESTGSLRVGVTIYDAEGAKPLSATIAGYADGE